MKKLALSAVLVLVCAAAVRADFTGTWDTNYGPLTMIQSGAGVTGSYYNGAASLQGQAAGCRMTLRYTEQGQCGRASFDLSPDGNSFVGKYRADGSREWYDWCGTRR